MAKLDNALLDTTWTDARAAKLDNLDAAVSTRLAAADYTAPDNSNIAAIKAKTDNLNFSGTDVKATLDGEKVTVSSNEDKTGYKLASDGLDSVSTTAPTGVASNFREMIVQLWRRFFKKATLTSTELKTYADDGTTPITTQSVSDDGTTQTQEAAS